MTLLAFLTISVATIIAAALVSAYVNVSRERLWLRAKKAEDLYRAVEDAQASMATAFAAKLDLAKGRPPQSFAQEAIIRGLTDVKVAVALYFPEVRRELACVDAGARTLVAALHSIETYETNGVHDQICNLDDAICNLRDAFEMLKGAVLRAAEIKESWVAQRLRRAPLTSHDSTAALRLRRA